MRGRKRERERRWWRWVEWIEGHQREGERSLDDKADELLLSESYHHIHTLTHPATHSSTLTCTHRNGCVHNCTCICTLTHPHPHTHTNTHTHRYTHILSLVYTAVFFWGRVIDTWPLLQGWLPFLLSLSLSLLLALKHNSLDVSFWQLVWEVVFHQIKIFAFWQVHYPNLQHRLQKYSIWLIS